MMLFMCRAVVARFDKYRSRLIRNSSCAFFFYVFLMDSNGIGLRVTRLWIFDGIARQTELSHRWEWWQSCKFPAIREEKRCFLQTKTIHMAEIQSHPNNIREDQVILNRAEPTYGQWNWSVSPTTCLFIAFTYIIRFLPSQCTRKLFIHMLFPSSVNENKSVRIPTSPSDWTNICEETTRNNFLGETMDRKFYMYLLSNHMNFQIIYYDCFLIDECNIFSRMPSIRIY